MRRFLLASALALLAAPAFGEWLNMRALKVAVLDVVSRVAGESIDTATLTEMLQVALVDRNEFRIVERSLLDRIVKEQELQVTGMTEGQAAKIGQLAGSDKVMLVSISKFADKYLVIVKGIDVKTGIVDLTDQVLSYSVGGFMELFPVLADRLVRKARGEAVAAFRLPSEPSQPPSGAASPAAALRGVGGMYSAEGTNPDGSRYVGSCEVTPNADGSYAFFWRIGDSSIAGLGTLQGSVMTVEWGDASPVVYKVQAEGRVLVGTWAKGAATETITRQ